MDKVSESRLTDSSRRAPMEEFLAGWRLPALAALLLALTILLALAGVVSMFQRVHADAIYPGVRVGGIEVGGMTRDRALSELQPVYQERIDRPLTVRAAGMEWPEKLEDLGATLDARAAVEAAFEVGRTDGWREQLVTQANSLLHGFAVESPGVHIDRAKVRVYVSRRAAEVDRQVKDAELKIGDDLSINVTNSVVGRKLDLVAAQQVLESAMMSGAPTVDLPVVETAPRRVEADLEKAKSDLTALLAGPAGLEFQGDEWTFSQEEILDLLKIDDTPGIPAITVTLKEEPLKKMIAQISDEIDQPKVNARFDWNGGNLKMLSEGQDGRKVNQEKALSMLVAAIRGDQRMAVLPVDVQKAAGDSIDPSQLGITDLIEFGRTSLSGVPEKIHNVKLAASRLNGVLLARGDTFSFNRELGPTTLKSGFQTGFAISVNEGQMETVPSVAGGICQVATTLLQAVFQAGYQIEERYPHLYWIPNYGKPPKGMVGLDATVDDPVLDFKFVNNTDDYLLVQSVVENNTLEFRLYGKKPKWRVEIDGPFITDIVKADPAMVREVEPSWPVGKEVWVESATDGMKVSVVRRVIQGSDVRTLNLKSDYRASRNVVLVGGLQPPPTPAPSATPTEGAPAPGATPSAPGGGSSEPAVAPTAAPPDPGQPQPAPAPAEPPQAGPSPSPASH